MIGIVSDSMQQLFATWVLATLMCFSGGALSALAADAAPIVSDENRLIRLETKVETLIDLLNQRMDHLNQRMDHLEQRMDHLEQRMDRIEQRMDRSEQRLDRRFQELRTDMNSQFDRLNALLIGLCSVFGLLVVALFGFVLWDRRSMLRPLETDMRRLEGDLATKGSKTRLDATVNALRAWAQGNDQLVAVLKRLNLM